MSFAWAVRAGAEPRARAALPGAVAFVRPCLLSLSHPCSATRLAGQHPARGRNPAIVLQMKEQLGDDRDEEGQHEFSHPFQDAELGFHIRDLQLEPMLDAVDLLVELVLDTIDLLVEPVLGGLEVDLMVSILRSSRCSAASSFSSSRCSVVSRSDFVAACVSTSSARAEICSAVKPAA